MDTPNPIPTKFRGWIYITGAGIGGLSVIATSLLVQLGLVEWVPLVAVTAAQSGIFLGVLGRSNLSDSASGAVPEIPPISPLP